MVSLDNCHRCRADPFEATIYCLEATSRELEIFRAIFEVELTIEPEKTVAQQSEEKPETSSLELPLNFSREYAVKVEKSSST